MYLIEAVFKPFKYEYILDIHCSKLLKGHHFILQQEREGAHKTTRCCAALVGCNARSLCSAPFQAWAAPWASPPSAGQRCPHGRCATARCRLWTAQETNSSRSRLMCFAQYQHSSFRLQNMFKITHVLGEDRTTYA